MNADAGILDGKLGDLVMVAHAECHVAAVGEFDRVGQKIAQNLPKPILVGLDHDRQASRADMAELMPLAVACGAAFSVAVVIESGESGAMSNE